MRIKKIVKIFSFVIAAVLSFSVCTGFTWKRLEKFSAGDLPHTFSQVFRKDQTGRGFTWCTGTNYPNGVAYLIEGELENADWSKAARLEVTTEFLQGYEKGDMLEDDGYTATYEKKYNDDQKVYVHKAAAENLVPGVTYSYLCGAEGVSAEDSITGEITVRSDADYITDGLTFIHVTDTQQGSLSSYEQNYYRAMQSVYQSMNPDFILHTGDITDNNWDGIARIIQFHWANDLLNEAGNAPVVMVSTGNHDMEDSIFNSFYNYDLPETASGKTGSYCAYTLGNVLFINVDTNESGFARPNGLSAEQVAFIEETLKNSDADFKIIQTHKGLLSNGKHHLDAEMPYIRQQLMPLLDKYDVDLFLNGHDHIYSRTVPVVWNEASQKAVRSNDIAYSAENSTYRKLSGTGTVHITLQPAGTKREILPYVGWLTSDGGYFTADVVSYLNGLMDRNALTGELSHSTNYQTESESLMMFARVNVKNDTLRYDVFTVDPADGAVALYDSFAIQKEIVTEKTEDTVEALIARINSLPVSVKLKDTETVQSIRQAYELLTDEQKLRVANYERLTDAETELALLAKEEQEDAAGGCGSALTVGSGAVVSVFLIAGFIYFLRRKGKDDN